MNLRGPGKIFLQCSLTPGPFLIRKPGEHIVEVFFRIYPIGHTGFQDAICGCTCLGSFGRVAEQPVLSAYRKGTDAVFHRVIVYFTDSVCQVTFEILFIAYGIEQGSSNTGFRQNCGENLFSPCKKFFNLFLFFPLTHQLTLLVFKLFQLVGAFLLRLVFTGDADGVFLLIKRVDFVCHKVGDAFFFELDGADDAVFLLNTEKGFFHAEGGDGAGEAPDLAGLLALFYVVFEGFGDGGGIFVRDSESAAGGVAGPGNVQRKIVLVHVLVEGLHGLHHYHQPGGRSRPGSSECT